ncbi:MAG: hypothetical protein HYS17_03800 [Micavibrio aeruginosavorus]|uniref:Lipoprotein n=1 Tax=Micavibrio aeruginosavorus TaxID=349221 RepID=A0A7T5R3J8_9BACT|nr:MAG: hypothetical protein HYS17_03800 [Micavibrio aeruginosavorus]
MSVSLKPYFRQAAAAGALATAFFVSGCATVVQPRPESCMGGGGVSVMGVGVRNVSFDEKCAAYQKERMTRETDISRAESLLLKQNDPVGNALGMLLSLELSPEARAQLEKRVGGKEKIRIAPETLAGLLMAQNETSRYVGLQIYAASPEDVHKGVDDILKAQGIKLTSLITPGTLQQEDAARAWAHSHAEGKATLANVLPDTAVTTRTTTGCTRTRTGNQVILDCPAPKSAPGQR